MMVCKKEADTLHGMYKLLAPKNDKAIRKRQPGNGDGKRDMDLFNECP